MKIFEKSLTLQGGELKLQFGKLAQAVDTSVYATLNGAAVLVTVAVGPENPAIDYFPLSIEYVEKLYAGGLIKGSRWIKREGRPSDEAVLTGRLIDRSVRPLFPKTYKKQVQVVITLLSVDGSTPVEILSSIAASSALAMSSIPWDGPISTTKIGYDKSFLVNPSEKQMQTSSLNLVVSSTKEKVVMIETEADAVKDEIIQEGIELAKKENKKVIEFIESLHDKVGKKKSVMVEVEENKELLEIIKKSYTGELIEALKESASSAGSNSALLNGIIEKMYVEVGGKYDKKQILAAITKYNYAQIKENMLKKGQRVDGRKADEVRELYIETGLLPRTHGSALFQRGQTQILSIVTLGSTTLEQLIEGPEGKEAKRYIHHYSDGPYSYGQTGRMFGPSRRAIGHGALAEKAIEPVLPDSDAFPYAIRVVSEILAENGSSSMGSVCGSSLALMDAGVPIRDAVAGIAMGIMTESDDKYVVLTDIVGLEDFSGEMDFKIAGTKDGITAIQLDVKNKGLTGKMIKDIFEQGKKARLHILDGMKKVIEQPRKDISEYAPKVVIITPPQDKIGEIIGPGGKNIRALIARTETEINIGDDGRVTISGLDRAKVAEAVESIANITRELQVGEVFDGVVMRVLPFGAFVECLPGKEGMVHVSKMGKGFVRDASKVVEVGQKVKVKVYQVDSQGRVNLEMI
ncbi:MAG: polyribonucleotide nucleotidyltransferase [Patescibacteria group bacterium]